MARQLLLACLIAGLSVTAFALELCPEKSAYNGCRRRGCTSMASRRQSVDLVCAECGEGYSLVNKGTTRARCECAAGYAAKGNGGICRACPSYTVAAGGSTLTSECLKCPESTKPSADRTACTCSAGHYRASVTNAGEGFAPVACKPCTARTAYITGNSHTSGSCSTCPRGQVANKAHTWCVDPMDPDAASNGTPIPGLNITLGSIQEALQRGRDKSQENMLNRMDGEEPAGNPLNRLTQLVAGSGGEAPQAPKLPTLSQVASGINSTLSGLRNFKPSDVNLGEVAKTLAPGVNSTTLQNLGQLVTKVTERVASVLPAMPDPLYVAGLKLDPQALADADLPPASSVAELFGKVMRTTVGDLDELTGSDWS